MSETENRKSDVNAKAAFAAELVKRGYSARITREPADITAEKNGQTYYFEVKYTTREKLYFGAATLTEWECAMKNKERYRFVVASKVDSIWQFFEYTPDEFIKFSTIPPFKIFFRLNPNCKDEYGIKEKSKSIRLTAEKIRQMAELFNSFRKTK